MIELTIKTLDAQNHHFTVPNDYTVEQLKEHIADTIQIPSESQRCIYLGQVLQNDAKLADCDVNGKVIHVVQRPPPSSAYAANANDIPSADSGSTSGRRSETHTGTMYLGAMAFPTDFIDAGGLTFLHQLHPRTNLPMSRLAVARNLLRRSASIINQLEHENYFDSNSDQNGQFLGFPSSNLNDEINGSVGGNGLEQPEVEIRVESPSDVNNDIPSPSGLNNASTDQQNIDDSQNADTASNSQTNDHASGPTNNDDSNRRRPSRTPMMATVMGAVLHAQIRLIPFMRLLRQYLIQDTAFGPDAQTTHTEQQVQSLYNSVSELMHYFAHIYHSLSDIMCDFNQPPPRTLRCRPVIVQQQHATVLRSGARGRSIIRSPLVAVTRSVPSTGSSTSVDASASSTTAANGASATTDSNAAQNDTLNRAVGTSSVQVVIEEADTTNLPDNADEGTTENMDVSEPVADGSSPNGGPTSGGPTVTMRTRGGNAFVIQSMPTLSEGILPDGIRINSVEATILAPNEDIATAFAGNGNNQRWRAGILPADVLQNMFGFINQFRDSQRQQQQPPRDSNGSSNTTEDRPRQSNAENGAEGNLPSNMSNNTSDNNGQSSNTTHERLEFDIAAGVSRTFDPFLPCHSHHIHPISRATNTQQNATRNTGTQASSNQSGQSSQQTQAATQTSTTGDQQSRSQQQQQQEPSESPNNENAGQQSANQNDTNGVFGMADVPRNVASLINNIFPGLNIGNLMIRRGTAETENPPAAGGERNNQGRQSARARIQLTSNLNAMFPSAIQIEIDPLTNNVHTNIIPNNASQSNGNRPRRRTRPACRRNRPNATSNENGDAAAEESTVLGSLNGNHLSTSSSSSASTSSLSSSDEDIAEAVGREKKKPKKEKDREYSPSKTIKNFYSMIQKESGRSHLSSKKNNNSDKEVATNYPLYQDNQEALFFDIVSSAIKNISLELLTRDGESDTEEVASSVCRNIRNYLSTRPNSTSSIKKDLLNLVNVLVNNDLYKMKNLLDSDCVKQEIDLVSTICKFNQDSVSELLECIINCEDLDESEIKKFYQIFKFYIARLLTLFVHCIAGNDKTNNIRAVLSSIVEEILLRLPRNEVLTHWLRHDLINHVISFSKICLPDNLPAFMKHYVVYRLPPIMPVKCTVATALTSVGNSRNQTTGEQQQQPMDVEEAAQSSSSASSEASFVSANSEEQQAAAAIAAANPSTSSSQSINSITVSAESVPPVVLNSEEWHRSFPSDWVPIIARDIHRLRRQGSQPPYSDAYLSGMPTKRRKLIKKNRPNPNSNEQTISDNITSAINTAGLSSSSNPAVNENTLNPSNVEGLNELAKEELKENVRENIVQQTDFLPRRFPDSAKYFLDK